MRWSRIKNIIILLLVIVNGFLLALVGVRAWRTEQGARETRERMVEILSNNGIAFLPEEVPGALELAAWQVNAEPPGQTQAAALVGEVTETETTAAGTTYVGARGTVTFSAGGGVEASFLPGGWSAGRERIDAAVDHLRRRYGYMSIRRAVACADPLLGQINPKDGHTVHPVGYFGG